MRRVGTIAGVSLLLALGGCATQWAPGPGQSINNFEQTRAQCSLMARHGGGDFSVSGSQRFVAGSMIGYAVGDAIRTQGDFTDCMKASGFVQVTQQAVSQQAPPLALSRDEKIRDISRQKAACLIAVHRFSIRKQQYEQIMPRFIEHDGTHTMKQLTDDSRPTPAESELLSAYWDDVSPCLDA